MTTLSRAVLAVLASLAVLAGGWAYRSHLIDLGAAQEAQAAQVRQDAAVKAARASDAKVSAAAVASLQTQLTNQKAEHDRVSRDLQAALAASDLRAARLDARVAGLLDQAAELRERAAGAAGGTGSAPGEAGGDQADASVADLVESVEVNYGVCNRNATRLEALQAWYAKLRVGRQE
ncbi:hypothetical protein [Xylophilus sp.]|uniref:hypothetical protein n=1 Tax=Xylophilus sp. TaxID=2653893 RepID=UPI002D81156F|nr:hypothetical protein [Xylophilus sp.]